MISEGDENIMEALLERGIVKDIVIDGAIPVSTHCMGKVLRDALKRQI